MSAEPIPPAPSRPALRRFGSKWRLAPWLISLMPAHRLYVEPWAGSCAILLRKPPAAREVVNDCDRLLWNFFHVLRTRTHELLRQIELTPYHRLELELACQPCEDPLERARRFYVVSWQNWNGHRVEDNYSWRRPIAHNGPAVTANWNQFDHLWAVVARLKQVMFDCEDWRRCLERYDRPDALFVCDPPYLPATRSSRWSAKSYQHEMTTDDHMELLERVQSLRGAVLLCGYPSQLYDDALRGWQRNQRTARTDGGQRIEVVWTNRAAGVSALKESNGDVA